MLVYRFKLCFISYLSYLMSGRRKFLILHYYLILSSYICFNLAFSAPFFIGNIEPEEKLWSEIIPSSSLRESGSNFPVLPPRTYKLPDHTSQTRDWAQFPQHICMISSTHLNSYPRYISNSSSNSHSSDNSPYSLDSKINKLDWVKKYLSSNFRYWISYS